MKIQEERKVVRLKKFFLVCGAALLATAGLQAAPVSCTTATTFTDLAADGSCTLGDKTYSNFMYTSTAVNDTPVPENQVVILSTSETTAANGFMFSLPLGAGPTQTQDISMGYTVTDTTAGSLITSVDVPVFVGGATNGGISELDETVLGPSGQPLGSLALSPSSPSGSLTFAGVTSVTIVKDSIVKGAPSGSGNISAFTDFVDQTVVPEPGFYGVLAGGMSAVLICARRRQRQRKA